MGDLVILKNLRLHLSFFDFIFIFILKMKLIELPHGYNIYNCKIDAPYLYLDPENSFYYAVLRDPNDNHYLYTCAPIEPGRFRLLALLSDVNQIASSKQNIVNFLSA